MENHPYALPAGIERIEARQWKGGMSAYIWEETGEGSLRLVTSIRAEWWIVTGCCSWCCCPDTELFVCPTMLHVEALQTILRDRLATRRKEWARQG